MKSNLTRRTFLKGAAAGAGALAGTRLAGGRLIGDAMAAGEKAAVVTVYFQGGFNAMFGSADSFLGNGAFDVATGNVLNVGSGVFTDKATLGTMPKFALDHMAAIGVRHGNTAHFATEKLILQGSGNFTLTLANAMGGNAAIKAVYLGPTGSTGFPGGFPPAVNNVSLQRITDMKTAISALGGGTPDPTIPDRDLAASGVDTAKTISQRRFDDSPTSLVGVKDGMTTAIDTLKKPVKPFSFAELATAYGLPAGQMAVDNTFASKFAAAELMIRAGTNVVCMMDARDTDIVPWDFHQVSGGRSLNGLYSRNRMTSRVINPLRAFLNRMLDLEGYNVTVALIGDFSRSITGDHLPNLTANVYGRYVKQGTTGKVDSRASLPAGAPGVQGFWSYLAATSKLTTNPFGANPHALVL